MAISVKSVSQMIADKIRKFISKTSFTDVTEGSAISVIFEAASIQDFQNQVAVLKVLESTNLESLIGSDLDNKATEMGLPDGIGGVGRQPSARSSGIVRISSGFTKKSSAAYIGKPTPFAGSTKLYLQDATGWPSTGSVYIGRGTANEEGPIPYTGIANNTTFFTLQLNLSTPLVESHSYTDSVILAQGGLRNISSGTVVSSPASAGSPAVSYSTDVSASLLDGESEVEIPVSCQTSGEEGNVSAGAIKEFSSTPFSGAVVQNPFALSNGSSAESDEQLRVRIKNYVASLAKGTRTAITSSLLGLRDPVSGKTITSVNLVEPLTAGEAAKAYIDDGSGFEPTLAPQDYELLLSSASGQEVLFRTSDFPITPVVATGSKTGPFVLSADMYLDVSLDGQVTRFLVNSLDFVNLSSVSVTEIVRSFNAAITTSGSQNIGFRTADGLKYLSVFDLSGKAEKLKILPGTLQNVLGFQTEEIRPLFLYQNNSLLSFKGNTASVETAAYPWASLSASDLVDIGIEVDGVAQYFTVSNADFSAFGSTVSTASLASWISVLKKKVSGLNIYVAGVKLALATWQGSSSEGSVRILEKTKTGAAATWIGTNKMFATAASSVGSSSQYELNRLNGQIKLRAKPPLSSDLTVASINTRAEIKSLQAATGFFNTPVSSFGTPKMVVAADGDFAIRSITVSGSVSVTPSIYSANSNIIRLFASDISLFATIFAKDFLYIAPDSSVSAYMTPRLNACYRVMEKGLNTRSADITFVNSILTFATPVSGVTTVTVVTSGEHKLVVGQIPILGNVVLSPVNAPLATIVQAAQTVTEIVNPTTFKFQISYSGAVSSGPNSSDVSVAKDSYIDIEVSDLQREAFFGLFLAAPVSYTVSSSIVTVTVPRHGLSGGFFQINAVSAGLLNVFPGLSGYPGPFAITSIVDENNFTVNLIATATLTPPGGAVTLNGQYTTVFSAYDISDGMFSAFKCEGATPQIIDLGTLPTKSADQMIAVIASAVGMAAYKINPKQISLVSQNYSISSTLAVLAVSGDASNVFAPSAVAGIQSHVAAKRSQSANGGFPIISSVSAPTLANLFYPTRGALKFATTETLVKDLVANPAIQASSNIVSYPRGLQEIGISGRELGHTTRVYNNSISAPFAGFARGAGTIPPVATSIHGTNEDLSTQGLRLSDIPFGPTDSLVVEMDLDSVNKTTAIPMAKRAVIENMNSLGSGAGAQLTFTLRDPDDEITPGVQRPFFEVNSPYKNFDFTDFNILFKPTLIHTVYSSLPFVGNPTDAFVIKSTQFGANHELRFGFLLPSTPGASALKVSHKTFEESAKVVEIVNCVLASGGAIAGSDYSGIYNVTPANLTSPTGAAIVQLSVNALGLNLSGAYQIGNILSIGGNATYSGSYLIVALPDANTVVVASPGIRAGSYSSVVYDGSQLPLLSFPLLAKTMIDVRAVLEAYFANNPVISVSLTGTTIGATVVKYPSYYTHGSLVPNLTLSNQEQSFNYHSKKAYFGSLAHIHTYSLADNKIVAVVQNPESVLPLGSDLASTGYPANYVGEECLLLPANAKSTAAWLKFTAVSPLSIQSSLARVGSESVLQLSSLNSGSEGAVRVTGVAANSSTTVVKASPFKLGGALKIRTDFATAQSFPRDSLVEVINKSTAPIYRAYRSQPGIDAGSSAETTANSADVNSWFRPTTVVSYSRPYPNIGRFVFRKSLSGANGGETLAITKPSAFIAKIQITAGSGVLSAKVGDMMILRGSQTAADVSYTSLFAANNQCTASAVDQLDRYLGYPVLHVEDTKTIYVLAPNLTAETVTLRDTSTAGSITPAFNIGTGFVRLTPVANFAAYSIGDVVETTGFANASNNGRFRVRGVGSAYIEIDSRTSGVGDESPASGAVISRKTTEVMFIPALKNEKNIRTTYKSGAPLAANWKVNTNETMYYRIKALGNGFGYADFSFSSHADMELDGMSVSSDDLIQFTELFSTQNRGRFKIVAHNGTNAVLFKNPGVVDEVVTISEAVVNGVIGSHRWQVGPKGDADISTADKRPVRIWDADSIFENDSLNILNPAAGVTDWFEGSLVGQWKIQKVGIDRDYESFVEAFILNATTTSRVVTLGNSFNSVSFTEGTPYVGYKWVAGYGHNSTAENEAEIFVMPQTQGYKINSAYSSYLKSTHKLGFDAETTIGVDGYKFFTGLISEAHKVIDGSTTNTLAYPGSRAAGTLTEVQAPLIKSLTISLEIQPRDGVSINAVKNPVKSVLSSYINSLGVGQQVILSELTKRAQNVPGVKSVVIVSTFPIANNGIISVGSFEVPKISRPEDILI